MSAGVFSLPMEWTWEPSVLIGLALFTLAYSLATGPLRKRLRLGGPVDLKQKICFHAGTLLVFLALCSPLDALGDEYLFSAHMAQHLLLTFLAPPLWLLGLPDSLAEKLVPKGILRKVFTTAISPVPAFLIFNGVMWAWHIPAAYQATLADERIHIIEHLTFMASAVIGWAPVIMHPPLNLLAQPLRGLYLVASTFSCTALAALFTFSSRILYPFYATVPSAGMIAPLADQQMGGLFMWLAGDTIFVAAILAVIGIWLVRQPAH